MNKSMISCSKILPLLLLGIGCDQARAASLLLDFGPTVVVSSNANLSMGHFAGAVPSTEVSWNTVTADVSSGLLYSDGSSASGVSLKLGRSSAGVSNSINYNLATITSSALGGQINTGIYIGTSPLRDGLFATGTTTIFTNAFGIRVDGLAAGAYTVYISGRNTSTAVTASERFFCTNGASGTSFPFTAGTTPSVDELNLATTAGAGNPNAADAFTASFAYGDNCVLLTATLNTGDSLYLAATGIATNETRGFLNSVEIVPGSPVLTNFAPIVTKQPISQTVYQGSTLTFTNLKYAGYPVISYQWQLSGSNISGATNSFLVVSNATAAMSGNYTVTASNSVGSGVSSNAVASVIPLFNTTQMTNVWNLLPGDRFYITVTNNTSGERSLTYNPATSNLLIDCQLPSNNLVVLDPITGAEKYFMNLGGVPAGAAGLNQVAVASDGTVYGANVTANAGSASTPYILWQWANDSSNTIPAQLLSGDPGIFAGVTGLRWGDNLTVRGSGADTQILTAPSTGTNVCIFTTADGANFSPVILAINNVPPGFGQFGVSFGSGNTFWAKSAGQSLYLVQFDLNSGTGDVLDVYSSSNGVPNSFRFISTDSSQKWLGGVMSVASGLPDNVRLYDISDLSAGPVLSDQELYTTTNPNTFLTNGTGATVFGGGYLFALDSQNGVKAFLINTNASTGLLPFSITGVSIQSGNNVVVTWQSVAGHSYQIQSKTNLTDAAWSNLGPAILANGTVTSTTNAVSGIGGFYRVQGQ